MKTAVVSGRVDTSVKEKADAYLKEKGVTPVEAIKNVWAGIATTGQVPGPVDEEEALRRKRALLADLLQLADSLPPNAEFTNMTKAQVRDFVAGKYE